MSVDHLTDAEIDALRGVRVRGWIGRRDRVMLLLLLDAGLRRGEACGLDLGDVDFDANTLRVRSLKKRGEGGIRLVPMSDRLYRAVDTWLGVRGVVEGAASEALLVSRGGRRLSLNQVNYAVSKLAKRAGIVRRVWPHLLRASFATRLYAQGLREFELQALLGHSDVGTTRIYTATPPDALERARTRLNAV